MKAARACALAAAAVALGLSFLVDGWARAWFFPGFRLSRMPDLTGQVALVTGPTLNGIGHYTALELARKGAHVVLGARARAGARGARRARAAEPPPTAPVRARWPRAAGRSEPKGQETIGAIRSQLPAASVEFLQLDLSSLGAVRESASEFLRRHRRLHMLVLNAGVMACPFELSHDGCARAAPARAAARSRARGAAAHARPPAARAGRRYEMQFATNHLGHFLLTYLLADTLSASAPARVAVVSSAASFIPEMLGPKAALPFASKQDVDKASEKAYGPWAAYGRSKLANVLFAAELAERFGPGVHVNALHPGGIATNLQRHLVDPASATSGVQLLGALMRPLLMHPRDGALTQLYLAASADVPERNVSGGYFHPQARRVQPSALVTPENRAALWALSMQLTAPHRSWFSPSASKW